MRNLVSSLATKGWGGQVFLPTSQQRRWQKHSYIKTSLSSSNGHTRTTPTTGSMEEARGYSVEDLSVTAGLIRRSESRTEDQALAEAAAATATAGEPPHALSQQAWVQELVAAHPECKLVFSAHGNTAETAQHLSTGLSADHLFLSLLQNGMLQDMLILYTAERKTITMLRLGEPVCGHPTIVHGGLISAIFDETFGVALFAAGRWGHFDLTMVFTARLEVDYKKPVPAEATVVCEAEIESIEGRKIWLTARLTDPTQQTVYAASRALFVRPREAAAAAAVVAAGQAAMRAS